MAYQIIIPLPTKMPQSYGIEATSGPHGCIINVRMTKKERDKIHAAAQCIGITSGTLMRRTINDVADFILAEEEKRAKLAADDTSQDQ